MVYALAFEQLVVQLGMTGAGITGLTWELCMIRVKFKNEVLC